MPWILYSQRVHGSCRAGMHYVREAGLDRCLVKVAEYKLQLAPYSRSQANARNPNLCCCRLRMSVIIRVLRPVIVVRGMTDLTDIDHREQREYKRLDEGHKDA